MKQFYTFAKKNLHYIIYAVFLMIQAFNLFPLIRCGDDYYYSAFFKQDLSYFLSETAFHYTETNGRFFVHLLDEILLAFPLGVWKVFEFFVIALIVWLCAKIASGRNEKLFPASLILCTVCFALIGLPILRESVYWATGSLNYVFPVLLVLSLYRVFTLLIQRERGAWYLPLLSFFAAFTTEQSSAAALFICLALTFSVVFLRKKKCYPSYILSILTAAVAFISVIFAPGNAVRQGYYPEFYASSFLQRLKSNFVPYMFNSLRTDSMFVSLFIFFLLAAYVFWSKARKSVCAKLPARRLHSAFFLISALFCAAACVSLFFLVLASSSLPTPDRRISILVICAAVLLCEIYYAVRFIRKKETTAFIFFSAAAAVFAAMILSPVYGPRTTFISVILLIVPTLRLFRQVEAPFVRLALYASASVIAAYRISFSFKVLLALCAIAILAEAVLILLKRKARPCAALTLVMAFLMLFSFGLGYFSNYKVNSYNDRATEEFVKEASGGILTLAYPENKAYSYGLPFMDSYQAWRFKLLYGIPLETEIVYKTSEELGIK